jgi:hypothetical protein
MLVAASPSVRPTMPASARLKSTFRAGLLDCSWIRASAIPATRRIRDSSVYA